MNNFDNRGTGRTYAMINLVADCIQDGQPMVIIVGNNHVMCDYMMTMLVEQLERRGLNIFKWSRSRCELIVEGSVVRFMTSTSGFTNKLHGISPCWFVDHACLEITKLDPADYEFLMRYPQRKCKWCDE